MLQFSYTEFLFQLVNWEWNFIGLSVGFNYVIWILNNWTKVVRENDEASERKIKLYSDHKECIFMNIGP